MIFGHARTLAAGACVLVLVLGVSPQAFAEQGPSEDDGAFAVVQEIVPTVASETSDQDHVEVESEGGEIVVSVGTSGAPVEGLSDEIAFSVDYATGAVPNYDGTVELSSSDDQVVAVVQPTGFGVRVLTIIGDSSSSTSYGYTFEVPDGTELISTENLYYLAAGDQVLGSLQIPWAIDAAGSAVPTSFTWSGKTLTQHVDLSDPAISYPVVADPAWGYTYNYNVTKTPSANRALLKSCFNCYFPVTGAPRAFPVAGQLLPLKVSGLNFECRFKRESTATNYFGFQFDATANHVDKLGSNITFEFRIVGGVRKLIVSAYIVNDAVWANSSAYRAGAALNWGQFATRLNNAPTSGGR